VAIDAGTNQSDWKLRTDERVEVREKTNARFVRPADFDTKFDLIVMDVSFISVTKILPALVPLMKDDGRMVVLIKPQFEAGREQVGKGGIVRDESVRDEVVKRVNSFAESLGLAVKGTIESPILGAEGNKEFLSFYEKR
jgi:23S rRNA (cytidine1920-2'-O)/16S rRNA (cytidine1409-2'-O)-methyltransferase